MFGITEFAMEPMGRIAPRPCCVEEPPGGGATCFSTEAMFNAAK